MAKAQLVALKKRFKIGPNEIVAVSPRGKWMARGVEGRGSHGVFCFEVRDTQRGKLRSKVDFDEGQPDSVEFSPSGDFLIIRFYDYITFAFDTRSGSQLWVHPATQTLFSSDESIVVHVRQVASRHGAGGIRIWTSDPKTGRKSHFHFINKPRVMLPVWFDGPDHIRLGDSSDNLWRLRVR